MNRIGYLQYLRKSFIWYVGNFIFGIIPLLFLWLAYIISRGKIGFDDMDKLIHEGAILFVAASMMGGVLVDFLQSGTKMSGRQIFVVVISPILAISLLCLQYLFVVLKIINADCFNITSWSTIFVVCFSLGYCLINKTNLLIQEDTKHE
jgi:hypothetical protein